MSEIRVNKLIDEAGTGAVELTQGATLPSGKTISGAGTLSINTSGTGGTIMNSRYNSWYCYRINCIWNHWYILR